MEDLYDDRPIEEGGNEGRPLQDRISMSNNDHYNGIQSSGELAMDDAARYENSYDNSYVGGRSASGKEDSHPGHGESSIANKDPEELRQKVLESLAEKKKKAAEFMNMEKEGANIHKDQHSDSKGSSNAGQASGETGNPERDAAVDALLATFGSGKEETGPSIETGSRKNSDTTGAPSRISPGTSDVQQLKHEQYKYDDAQGGSSRGDPRGPRRASEYSTRHDDPGFRDRDGHGESRHPAYSQGRGDYRGGVRGPSEYDDKDRRGGPKHDTRYRHDRDRFEDPTFPKDSKPRSGPNSLSGRKPIIDRYQPAGGEQRKESRDLVDPREYDYYRGPEVARVDHPKDAYGAVKPPPRYPAEPGLSDVEYNAMNRDYPPYPPAPRGYPPRDDPRYPAAATRPPETDYAALYYRDLTEWLEITGYHDYTYRQQLLSRQREARAFEEGRYAMERDSAYPPPRPRPEEADPRAPRSGPSMYTMPHPHAPGAWDDRDAGKRGPPGGAPVRSGYPPVPDERDRGAYRGDDLTGGKPGMKRRPRDDDYAEQPHSAKSARHGYENPHRYGANGGPGGARSVQGEDPADETEAVRQALSRRIASARDREPSPSASARRRSMSPRGGPYDAHKQDFGMGRRSPGPFDRESHGRGRALSKYPPRDDFKKPFRPRRESFGEPPSPYERKPFGRGRGRGFSKDYPPYDRNDQYHRRNTSGGDMMEIDRISGFPGESTRNSDIRYFMIKSFNQENVKMAQQDNIWATQQKNAEILEQAFKEARDVILFFSINKSGKFQGYARMEGPPGSAPMPSWAKNLLWESSGPFRIRWISITDISFHRVAHLKNRLNENQPVLIGRDGQEIDPDCGAALCKTIDETAAFRKLHGPSEEN
ncbi:YT521-B-like domain-containing protein [Sphaerosporella brunnea]|uniref:YT521-B-like domain-containing protein n=1 Tax=Sphaerosporella brunnea TaxID=1250544 RepID=A0A5J5ETQ6_9PEZI|nr:YT521-B-like domain-containing protein [Sphaerosporella brunnea]